MEINGKLVIHDNLILHDAYNIEVDPHSTELGSGVIRFLASPGYFSIFNSSRYSKDTTLVDADFEPITSGIKCDDGSILVENLHPGEFILSTTFGSGIGLINGQTGPNINFVGASGVNVVVTDTNEITISATSGVLCYRTNFSNITDQTFTHNLNTQNLIIQVRDQENEVLDPDKTIIVDDNSVRLVFNVPQTGEVIIIACGLFGLDISVPSGIQAVNNQNGPELTINGSFGINVNSSNDILTVSANSISGTLQSQIPTQLDNLSDVSITSVTSGEILQHDGNNFVNRYPQLDSITFTTTSGTNINAAATDNLLGWTTLRHNLGSAFSFPPGGTTKIEINDTGYYMVMATITYEGAATRYSANLKCRVNNTTTLPYRGKGGYIRSTEVQDESSIHLSFVESFSAGDFIEFLIDRDGTNTTSTTLTSNQSVISIVRIG